MTDFLRRTVCLFSLEHYHIYGHQSKLFLCIHRIEHLDCTCSYVGDKKERPQA